MSRRSMIISAAVAGGVLVLAGGGVAAVFGFFAYQERRTLAEADADFAEERWRGAKLRYARYLVDNPEDVAVLEKYAEASSRRLVNRQDSIIDAGRAYSQLAVMHPEDAERRQVALEYLERYGLWNDLQYLAEELLLYAPDDAALQFYRALAIDKQQRAAEAIKAYEQMVESEAAPPKAYTNLAMLYQQQNLDQQAEVYLELLQERFPDDAHAHVLLGRHYLTVGDTGAAQAALERALALDAELVEAWVLKAEFHAQQEQWPEVIEAADKVRALDPDRMEGYIYLLYAYDALKRPAEGVAAVADMSPELVADNPQLSLTLAEVQIAADDMAGFEETLARHKEYHPNQFTIFKYLDGRRALAEGRVDEAVSSFTQVVESSPEFARAKIYQAVAHLSAGQEALQQGELTKREDHLRRARAALEAYLAMRPDDTRGQAIWDSVFGVPQGYDAAVATAERLKDAQDPETQSLVTAAQSLLAEARKRSVTEGDRQLATSLYERAIDQNPRYATGYVALAELFLEAHQLDRAEGVLERARENGIANETLTMMDALLALSRNDMAKAQSLRNDALLDTDATEGAILRWADMFARKSGMKAGLATLELAGKGRDVETQRRLAVRGIALTRLYGGVDEALGVLRDVEDEISETGDNAELLRNEKVGLAREFLNARASGSLETVTTLLAEVLDQDPGHAEAKTVLAQAHLLESPPKLADAERIAMEVLEGGEDVGALLVAADVASARGHYGRALAFARRAQSRDPERPSVRLAVAQILLQIGELDEALGLLEGISIDDANNATALTLLAQGRILRREFQQAEVLLGRLEEMADANPALEQKLASLRSLMTVSREGFDSAEQLLRAQYDADHTNIASAQALARALLGQGRGEEGAELLEEFAERNADWPEAWTVLGNYQLNRGGDDAVAEASAAYTNALVARRDFGPALRGMIEVAFRSNNLGRALSLCNRYLESQPDDPEVLYRKASVLANESNKLDEALAAIERALAVQTEPQYVKLRGMLRIEKGQYREAADDLRAATDGDNARDANVDAALAEAYAALENYELAQYYFDEAKEKASRGALVDGARMARIEKMMEQRDAS